MARKKGTARDVESVNKDSPATAIPVATERKRPGRHILNLIGAASPLHYLASSRFAAKIPHSPRTPYLYTPLKGDLTEIRLMTLHEGPFTADINISIHTVPLRSESPPIYEALSYVWGSTEDQIDIKIGRNSLAVTRNLAGALPYLRYTDKPRVLWIDAVCVNQQDLKERGHQVKKMADLYRLADRVIVWLGPAKHNSVKGLSILEHLGSQVQVDWERYNLEPASEDSELHWSDLAAVLPYQDEEISAINEIIGRSWFERLWIQQEIRLANQGTIFMCGFGLIAWQVFRKAIACLYTKPWSDEHKGRGDSRRLRNRLDITNSVVTSISNYSLIDIIEHMKLLECLDPRDRVYAILSLLPKYDEGLGIEPDYKKTTIQVYQDVALRYMAHHKDLGILASSALKDRPSEIPTWIPDWSVAKTPNRLPYDHPSGQSSAELYYKAPGVLSVKGVRLATVEHAKAVVYTGVRSSITAIRRHAPLKVLQGSYVAGGSLIDAYCCTIFASHFADMHLPPRTNLLYFQQSKDILTAILQPTKQRALDNSPGTVGSAFLDHFCQFCWNRSFFQTCEGYIGLAPRTAQPGDQISILPGCNQPLLLRPAPNLQYQVVGECYIHGWMQGQALLGPIPDHYHPIKILNKANTLHPGFVNDQTGKTQYNDPRLETRLEADGDEEVRSVRCLDGSDIQILTPKMLEKRGVKLQTFDLI